MTQFLSAHSQPLRSLWLGWSPKDPHPAGASPEGLATEAGARAPRPGLWPSGPGQGGGRAYLAGEGPAERLPIGAERACRVVLEQVLQPGVGAVLAQHHVAPVPELGQQEVAAASLAPRGHRPG